jgi:D-citramalate synthase
MTSKPTTKACETSKTQNAEIQTSNQDRILILDTTLRDGEQTQGISFSPEEKINIAKMLLEMVRVDRIEVASARVSRGEQAALAGIIDWARDNDTDARIEVLGFVDDGDSVAWIEHAGGSVINLLAKGSEKHCTTQLGKTLEQHAEDVRRNVAIPRAGAQGQSLPGGLVQRLCR